MQTQIKRNPLAAALAVVGQAVPGRARQSALPILGNVLIEATGAGLTLRGTDLNMTIEQTLAAESTSFGATTVPHGLLSSFIGALSGETIGFRLDRASLVVEAGRQTARLATLSADDFPARPDVAGADQISLGSADLKRLIRLTSLAMATDDTRPILHGLLWRLADGVLTLASADGFRLSVASQRVDWPGSDAFVLPAEAVKAIERLVGVTGVLAQWGEGRFRLDAGSGIVLTTQLVAGTFPNYVQLIPKAPSVTLTLSRAELVSAVAAAGVFAGGLSAAVRLVQDGAVLAVTAETSELGNSRATLPIPVAEGDASAGPVRAALNHKYLAELLGAIPTSVEYLTLGWTSPSSPVVVRAIGIETFVHVLMPLFVQWPAAAPVKVAAAAAG